MRRILFVTLCGCLSLFLFPHAAQSAQQPTNTYIVNAYEPLSNTDTTCDPVNCTFVEAVAASEALAGLDAIHFNLPGAAPHVVRISGPEQIIIMDSVIIDGATQQGYAGTPIVEINGYNMYNSKARGAFELRNKGGNTLRGLRISEWWGSAVFMASNNNVVEDCYLNARTYGVIIEGDHANRLVGNRISRNYFDTYSIDSAGFRITGANQTLVEDNKLAAIGGSGIGSASDTIVRRNHFHAPLDVTGNTYTSADSMTERTIIQGNMFGIEIGGLGRYRADPENAVYIRGTVDTLIGGPNEGNGNQIASSHNFGIWVDGDEEGASRGTTIQGNRIWGEPGLPKPFGGIYVGPYAPGTRVIGNEIFGNSYGIYLDGTPDATIQGNTTQGHDSKGGLISGNDIGIYSAGASTILIGGTQAEQGNTLYGNGTAIAIAPNMHTGKAGTGVRISGNAIWGSSRLGIDVVRSTDYVEETIEWMHYRYPISDGITANDAGDGDSGPNGLQNAPVIASASQSGDSVSISGSLNSKANSTFEISFYSNAACSPSGRGEGEHYLGMTSVTTDGSGNATFAASFTVSAGDRAIAATATDTQGSTSEFSACALIGGGTATGTPPPPTGTRNLVKNGSFEADFNGDLRPDSWVGRNLGNDYIRCYPYTNAWCSFEIGGAVGKRSSIEQTINQSGQANEAFTLRLWFICVNNPIVTGCVAVVTFTYSDGTTQAFKFDLQNSNGYWFRYEKNFTPAKPYSKIVVSLKHESDSGYVYFDSVELTTSGGSTTPTPTPTLTPSPTPTPTMPAGSDMISNGSYEADVDGNGVPDGWGFRNITAGSGRVCGMAQSGNCSVILNGGATTSEVYQRFNVAGNAGDALTLRVWTRKQNAGSTNYRAKAVLYYTDGTYGSFSYGLPSGTSDWVLFERSFNAQKPYSRIQVTVQYGATSGTVWFDSVALTTSGSTPAPTATPAPSSTPTPTPMPSPSPTPTPISSAELISNGSYETDVDNNGVPDGWFYRNMTAGSGRVCDMARDGNCSVRLNGGSTTSEVYQRFNIAGNAGDALKLRVWTRKQNAGSTNYRAKVVLYYTDGTYGSFSYGLASGTSDWILFERKITAQKPYSRMQVTVQYGSTSGTVWFDGFSLTK